VIDYWLNDQWKKGRFLLSEKKNNTVLTMSIFFKQDFYLTVHVLLLEYSIINHRYCLYLELYTNCLTITLVYM